eukprot:RCo025368
MHSFMRLLSVKTFSRCYRGRPSLHSRGSSSVSARPRVGVATCIFRLDGLNPTSRSIGNSPSVLLVQRGKDPSKGLWALPGGSLEFGETLLECAERELMEETGLKLCPGQPYRTYTALDVFQKDPKNPGTQLLVSRVSTLALVLPLSALRLHFRVCLGGPPLGHFVLVVVAGFSRGDPVPGDDAPAARWVPYDCIPSLSEGTVPNLVKTIDHALELLSSNLLSVLPLKD